MPSNYGPIKARRKPFVVEAFQFIDWGTAERLMEWANAYYVGRGFEHSMRREHEKDRGNGHILESAPEFMVFRTDRSLSRMDPGDWIIKDSDGVFSCLKKNEFDAQFEKVEDDE